MEEHIQSCDAHVWDITDSDGRLVCSEFSKKQLRHENSRDCLGCGVCESCIDRAIAAWEEWQEQQGMKETQ